MQQKLLAQHAELSKTQNYTIILAKSTKEPYMQNKNYTTKRGLALGHCKHYTTDNSNIYNDYNNHNLTKPIKGIK